MSSLRPMMPALPLVTSTGLAVDKASPETSQLPTRWSNKINEFSGASASEKIGWEM
jgi:hypothetical protein